MMKEIIIFVGVLAAFIYSGCEKNLELNSTLPLNDTIEIANFDTRYNYEDKLVLRMDSVLEDSRCPANVQCVWEGNARVDFILKQEGRSEQIFTLNTFAGFLTDTTVNGIRFEMIDMLPYPVVDKDYQLDDYILQILISD